jgi:carboxymethylenebutenolidase
MEIRTEALGIRTPEGEMRGHLACPGVAGRFPGIVVVMEAFGLNGNIVAVAERIAREGYVTLAPDLYYRFGSPVVPYGDVPKAIEWMRRLEPGRVVADIGAALGYLKSWPAVHGQRLGIVGFCMGGTVAIRSAGHHPDDLAAVVAFYGGASLAGEADLLGRIVAPVLAFWGEQDELIPLDQVRRFEEAMRRLEKTYEARVYPGAGHGFFCDERASYQPAAAHDAWALLTRFFRKYLN